MSRERTRTVKEAADLLPVNEVTVRRWIRDGAFRAIDIGKGWPIGAVRLDAFGDCETTRPAARPNGDTNTAPEVIGAQNTKEDKK